MTIATTAAPATATAAKAAFVVLSLAALLGGGGTDSRGSWASAYSVGPTGTPNGGGGSRRTFLSRTVGAVASAPALVATVLSMPANAAPSPSLPSVGTRAPDFVLPNSRGEGNTSLADLVEDGKGKKWTVLYFYPGAFTSGCTLEARGFQRDMDKYRKLGTQIVGVSVDSVEKNAQFCTSEGLDFYMLSDQGGQVSKLYGSALSIPGFGTFSNRQTYLIDPQGNLRWVFTDVESRVPRHSTEVLDKLEELQGVRSEATV